MDKSIKFSFWNYLPVGTLKDDIVDKWIDLNCNLFMSFRYLENQSKKEDMISLLDKAHEVGCKVIINDERNEYLRLKTMSKEEFRKGVEASIKDFAWHPAVFGFYYGDEPFSDQEENFSYTSSLLRELDPVHSHYGNLLPYWSGLLGEPAENNREDSYYYEKIRKMIKDGKIDILAFDQYTQCYLPVKDQALGIRQFLNGMHHFSTLAKEANIPLYVSLLSVGHYSYRDPSDLDIKWQINVSVAMGAQGIVWFFFHQHVHDYGYLNPPFLGEKAYITPVYGRIQRQQYIFNERYRKVFDNVDIDNYGFIGEGFDNLPFELNTKYVARFDILRKNILTLCTNATYRDDEDHKVMVVVNVSQDTPNVYSIYFNNGEECHFDLAPGDMRIFDLKDKDIVK